MALNVNFACDVACKGCLSLIKETLFDEECHDVAAFGLVKDVWVRHE